MAMTIPMIKIKFTQEETVKNYLEKQSKEHTYLYCLNTQQTMNANKF